MFTELFGKMREKKIGQIRRQYMRKSWKEMMYIQVNVWFLISNASQRFCGKVML